MKWGFQEETEVVGENLSPNKLVGHEFHVD